MLPIIIMIVSFILDGLLTNYLPYLVGDLSWFTPLLTVVSLFMIYPFYRKEEKKYFIIVFILGLLYDLFYTNLLFFNAVTFFLVGVLSRGIHKNYEMGFLKLILYTIIIICFYEGLTSFLLWIYHIVPMSPSRVFYKISHTLALNIIYLEIIYIIIKLLPKKYKNISIN